MDGWMYTLEDRRRWLVVDADPTTHPLLAFAAWQAKLELAATKRTNRDSLVEDVWAKNPKIKEEVRAPLPVGPDPPLSVV